MTVHEAFLEQDLLDLQNKVEEKDKRITELETQIDKMKCCFNCRHSRTEYEHCKTDKHEKWEMKEK